MHRSMLVATVLTLASVFGAVSLGDDKDKTEFLTKPGEYKLYEGKLIILIKEDDGELRFDITFIGSKSSVGVGSVAKAEKAKGWFIHPASPSQVWFYPGNEILQLLEFKPGGGPTGSDYQSTTTVGPGSKDTTVLLQKAPKGLVDRLPESFKPKPKDK